MMNKVFDTKYINYSYIVYMVKMESVCKIRIFGLKMKSGLDFFLKSLHAGGSFFVTEFVNLCFSM